jgi:hypothetical protein
MTLSPLLFVALSAFAIAAGFAVSLLTLAAYDWLTQHVSAKRVGGITFIRVGRLNFSYSESRQRISMIDSLAHSPLATVLAYAMIPAALLLGLHIGEAVAAML